MPMTITLKRLHSKTFGMDVQVNNQVNRINELLPTDIRAELQLNNGENQAAHVSQIYNCAIDPDGQIHSRAAFRRCADYISKLGNDDTAKAAIEAVRGFGGTFNEDEEARLRKTFANARLRKVIQFVAQKWNVADLINKRDRLKNIIKNDADSDKLSSELIKWLEDVIALRNEELLKQVLAVLTILSITRCVDGKKQHRWQEISEKFTDCLTTTTNFPENPLEEYRNHLVKNNEDWAKAQENLEALLKETANATQTADIFAEMGKFFLSDRFDGVNAFADPVGCKNHINWLYEEKFLPENKEVHDMLDVNNPNRNFSIIRLLRLAALDCFRKAQQYLENANDTDSWREVSASYLKHVRELYKRVAQNCLENANDSDLIAKWREVSESYLKHFKQSAQASTPKKHEEWYGETFLEIAKDCLEKKDSANFVEYLKLARELKDNDNAKNLALRALAPLEEDEDKEFFDSLKNLPEWKTEELIDTLKTSKDIQIRGEINWRIYVKSKDESYLRTAYRCGYPKALDAWNIDTVSYCEELQQDAADEKFTCFLNVDDENPIAKIFKATCPEATKFSRLADVKAFKNGNAIVLLVTDNSEKNLAEFLYVLESVKNKPSATITIFVKATEDKPTQVIIDTALQQFFLVDKEKRPHLRVEIIDEYRDAARFLLSKHPIFYPIRNKKLANKSTLKFVVIGDGELAKNLVREAAHLMSFHNELNITPKIILLSPFGRSLTTELKTVNPELAKQVEEPDDVLLPGFAVPPSKKGITLAEKINELIGSGGALYFAVALSQYNLNNLNLAIMARETILRHQIQNDQLYKEIPVAFYCPDPDISFLSSRSIVLGEEYKDSPTQFNTYALIPFGNRLRFTYRSLMSNIFSRLSLAVHLNYCGVTGDTKSDETEKYYADYAKKTYNRLSSLAVAISIPYRLFNYSQLFETYNVFDNDWEITDENAIFSESQLAVLATKINLPVDDNRTKKLYRVEHDRWIRFMTLEENWILATMEEVQRYIKAGNSRQQCFASAQHPCCLTEWENLETLSKEISKLLGRDKDFQKPDITSILSTSEIMKETVLRHSESLKKMFCLPN